MTQPNPQPAPKPSVPSDTHAVRVRPNRGTIAFFVIIFAALALLEWPSLKGFYYRAIAGEPAQTVAWKSELASALTTAQKTHKPILVDFSATWCPPCQIMKHESWPDPRVQALIQKRFVPVFIDVDAPATRDVAARYNIESLPTVLVLDPQGNVLHEASYLNADNLLAFLQKAATTQPAAGTPENTAATPTPAPNAG